MVGRLGSCLLAFALVFVAPMVSAQAGRTDPASHINSESPAEYAPVLPRLLTLRGQDPEHITSRDSAKDPRPIDFREFVHAAGFIFSGTVASIHRNPASVGQSVETVAITFRVENAIRGATPGQDLTIFQWIGLWSSGQRYRIGERVLLFLYPRSRLGLTSWVAGPMGHFAIDTRGNVLISARHLSVFRRDPVLGGKSRVQFSDFALAVRRAGEEE